MPNWCYTQYTISGEAEQLDAIDRMIKELESLDKPRVENGFGKLWLGCIVDYLGEDWHDIDCRGSVISYRYDEGGPIVMDVEIAWVESPSFRHLLEDKFEEIRVTHYSEEPGWAGYWTNDPDYPDKYYLDSCLSDIDSEYFGSLEEAADYLAEYEIKAEPTFESISHAVDEYGEEHDEYFSFHKIEYIDD